MNVEDKIGLAMLGLMIVVALYFIIRAKISAPPDYSDACRKNIEETPANTVVQTIMAQQDMDFRAGR